MADGALFNRIVRQFLQTSAERGKPVAFWQQPIGQSQATSSALLDRLTPVARLVSQAGTLPAMAKFGSKLAMEMLQNSKKRLALPYTAPSTLFNQESQQAKDLAFGAMSLSRIKHIAKTTGATVNEVVLTLCDQALHRYLQREQGKLSKPLVAMVPIKLQAQDTNPNDDLTPALISLGQSEAAPLQRLATIIESSTTLKHFAVTLSPAAYYNYSLLAALMYMLGSKSKLNQRLTPACNLILSNVPGPRKPLYMMGAEVTSAYPLSALAPDVGLNITVYSYNDTLHFGFTYCRGMLPNFSGITEELQRALDELELDLVITSTTAVRRQLDLVPQSKRKIPELEQVQVSQP